MSFGKINKIASSVSQFLADNEKISVPIMASRVRKASEEFPEDPTIIGMAQVLTRMANNNKSFITKAEFKKMYQGLYTRNSFFGEIFASELGPTELKGPTYYKRDEEGSVEGDFANHADPVLANALQSVFDNNSPLKMYSAKAALASTRKVAYLFSSCGLECRTSVGSGNPDVIVVEASFESPKGQTSVLVPVEVHEGNILEPSVFVSNRGSEELVSDNIIDYVKSYAGNKLNVNAAQVLDIVTKLKSNSKKEISSVALAVTRMKSASQEKSEFFVNQITGLEVDNNIKQDISLPEVKDVEIQTFAEKFDTALGRASFTFGERKLTAARKSLEISLRECGIKHAQCNVSDSTEDKIVFAVNINKTAFTVPVTMTTASPIAEVFICNGKLRKLDRSSIESVLAKQEVDYRAAAVASPLYNVKASELVETVRSAMEEKNLAKAEDALNVLANIGDTKAYGVAMSTYLGSLGKTASVKEEETQCCSRIIKSANSKFPICGHTGLPTHKVYQDRNGDCHPMYRKGMDESYEGASFMNHKIFF